MELNEFLRQYFTQLSLKNISNDNEFLTYDNFKNFIVGHYSLTHMEKNNYIKYVKVKRQILKLKDQEHYDKLLTNINVVMRELYDIHTFPLIDIKKYMYKINNIHKMIEDKKISLYNTIKEIRKVFDLKNSKTEICMKILIGINSLTNRYTVFLKYSKQLSILINQLIDFEYTYGIDHKMIELNNMERSYLGKKSEYVASKIMSDYVQFINSNNCDKNENDITYFYETNIDLLKLLNINPSHDYTIKGEVDGILIYKQNDQYIIDKIIEVKSSIKATFEDIYKFHYLQQYIQKINEQNNELNIKYKQYVFTNHSFVNIINQHLTNWTIYLCVNSQEYIEKSHLYFSTCLKIVDDSFINDFYINKSEYIIQEKYKIIENNRNNIDNLFNRWTNSTGLINNNCNIYISK